MKLEDCGLEEEGCVSVAEGVGKLPKLRELDLRRVPLVDAEAPRRQPQRRAPELPPRSRALVVCREAAREGSARGARQGELKWRGRRGS